MSNILEEIIAVTENYRQSTSRFPKQTTATTTTTTNSAPLPLAPVQNQQQHFVNAFAPSPRGVQDDFAPFSLLHATTTSPTHSYYEPEDQSVSFNPSLIEDRSQQNCNPSLPISSSIPSSTITVPTTTIPIVRSTPSRLSPTETNSSRITYVPSIEMPVVRTNNTWHTSSQQQQLSSQVQQPSHKSPKRSLDHMDVKTEPQTVKESANLSNKRVKRETSVVMPPSAKSILERREKAIREGRRKDAKLTETERRILRRLRNRESAERCRQRREEQAKQLQEKIKTMQLENNRLVEMAGHYKQTIQRLEKMIADFTAKQPLQKAN